MKIIRKQAPASMLKVQDKWQMVTESIVITHTIIITAGLYSSLFCIFLQQERGIMNTAAGYP